MFIVVFESITRAEAAAVSAKYYEQLQNQLKTQPGFIKETAYSSVLRKDGEVVIGRFVDDAAAHSWRKDANHLRIQKQGREHVMSEYRIRAGPLISPGDLDPTTQPQTPSIGRTVMVVEDSKDGTTPLTIDVLRSMDKLAENVTDVATYENDEKFVYIVSWDSEKVALEFMAAGHLDRYESVLCVRVIRDYGLVDRKEAPM